MKMKNVVDLVNAGEALYKFTKNGSVFCGLLMESFTPSELESKPFGLVKLKGDKKFKEL